MWRDGLAQNEGLLIMLPRSQIIPVWMKNMRIALDVVWIAADGSIVDKRTLPVCVSMPCQIYRPERQALYVLEVGAGRFQLNVGDRVEINLTSRDSPTFVAEPSAGSRYEHKITTEMMK